MAFEALNNAGIAGADLLVVLNDNEMSISEPVGALHGYLASLLSSRFYNTMRRGSKEVLSKVPPVKELAKRWEEHMSALIADLRLAMRGEDTRLRWIKAAVGKQVRLIAVDDVVYFQSDTKYTRVVLAHSEALIRTPLKNLIGSLDPDRFWQIHRGTIVNVDAVAGVQREDAERQFVLLKERPERLAVSRQFFHLFRQM